MDNPARSAVNRAMDTDVLIAGGGLNGTALALALAQAGLRVILVDPLAAATRADAGFDGRGYALSISSQRLLAAIGIWERVTAQVQPILNIKVSDGRAGEGPSPLVLEFDHAEIEEGPMGYMLEDRHLRPALMAMVAETGAIRQIAGASVTGHAAGPGAVTVSLSDGSELTAALLVGCDGKRSATAQRAGINRWGWEYGQSSLVCAVEHELPHHGTAQQFFMPPGPLAILPLPGNRSSIVWTETTAEAARISALPDEAFLEELRPRFGSYLGEIALAGARFCYPLSMSVAHDYVRDRVALLGDAAHAVHPVAGQGLNAGLKDVGALTEVLVRARRRGEDIGRIDVLRRYQSWRRFDVVTLALAMDATVRLFSNDSSVLRAGRDLGLGLVNRLAPLRRNLIREAAGLTGEVPRLNRGLPI
ncbi:FAD-dependent monooxygenase [Frigidibacter sp. ROC022]|uniref:FAD-dependent monooxygenase n=1 Tax=Frigidibacter sp. ROC022 TaxID=2971796 RepID=UPI00215A8CDE|nr:FAD-dependent monooxygenase [Frigidibacter sp. ROC022]MCR8724961.1 FAD-dependent monooxygenase [Frigidibacter sp. ROC022]